MIDFDEVNCKLAGHPLVRNVDRLPRGHVRLETVFLYPDGSSVDVFLPEDGPLVPPSRLSDLGQTTGWLLDVQVKPWLSKKRQRFVEDALRLYGVVLRGGALERDLHSLDELVEGVVHLGQACVRVADLTYTRRSSLQLDFAEDLEEVLADTALEYESNMELEGRFGKRVRVEFLVRGAHLSSAVLTLASGSAPQAHIVANEVFRRWYDLNIPARNERRLTVFDDRVDVYRDDDLTRLADVSQVVAFSDKQTLRDLLAA